MWSKNVIQNRLQTGIRSSGFVDCPRFYCWLKKMYDLLQFYTRIITILYLITIDVFIAMVPYVIMSIHYRLRCPCQNCRYSPCSVNVQLLRFWIGIRNHFGQNWPLNFQRCYCLLARIKSFLSESRYSL